jgi:L-threonylcarbamoyladenylate synthase
LILLASDVNFLYPYVEDASLLVPIKLQKQPTTYLLKASKNTSRLIRGDFDTVAVRLTDWQLLNVSNGTQTMSIDDYANFKLDTNK